MSINWNLPPGVSPSMLPGNRDEDVAYERWVDNGGIIEVCDECDEAAGCRFLKTGTEDNCRYVEQAFQYDWEQGRLDYAD